MTLFIHLHELWLWINQQTRERRASVDVPKESESIYLFKYSNDPIRLLAYPQFHRTSSSHSPSPTRWNSKGVKRMNSGGSIKITFGFIGFFHLLPSKEFDYISFRRRKSRDAFGRLRAIRCLSSVLHRKVGPKATEEILKKWQENSSKCYSLGYLSPSLNAIHNAQCHCSAYAWMSIEFRPLCVYALSLPNEQEHQTALQ